MLVGFRVSAGLSFGISAAGSQDSAYRERIAEAQLNPLVVPDKVRCTLRAVLVSTCLFKSAVVINS